MQLTLNRPAQQNSLSASLQAALHAALDAAEHDESCRLVLIAGTPGCFCSGMDLGEALGQDPQERDRGDTLYKRLTTSPALTVSMVDGEALAGGVGLAAACDLVVATERARFSLPEALLGLVAVNVIPYLIRRVGFQKAYDMALTTRTVNATEAHQFRLVDILTATPEATALAIAARLQHIPRATVGETKRYFRQMWLIDEAMEREARSAHLELFGRPEVRDLIAAQLQRAAGRKGPSVPPK
jgi:polyketide biosynthesis enoyl-CoA hydratase PksH